MRDSGLFPWLFNITILCIISNYKISGKVNPTGWFNLLGLLRAVNFSKSAVCGCQGVLYLDELSFFGI